MEIMEKDILREFLECYRGYPNLWNATDIDYQNKRKREKAYQHLLKIYHKIKPQATITDVRHKINSIRCGHRRELSKIRRAQKTGTRYQPTVWWYNLLDFLPPPIKSERYDEDDFNGFKSKNPSNSTFNSATLAMNSTSEPSIGVENDGFEEISMPRFKVQLPPLTRMDSTLNVKSSQRQTMSDTDREVYNENPQTDPFQLIGLTWANKLRNLSSHQRIYAEKAINDILFEAELGTLDRYSVHINIESNVRNYDAPQNAIDRSQSNDTSEKFSENW